jgi:RNA polymerase sigma-70 factor (ECF subfamily)
MDESERIGDQRQEKSSVRDRKRPVEIGQQPKMVDDLLQHHAGTIQSLWAGVAQRYQVSEQTFTDRVIQILQRSLARSSGPGKSTERVPSETPDLPPPTAQPQEADDLLASLHAEELVHALACEAGDERAWLDFESRFRAPLQSAARALTKDDGEAEELVQYVYGELYGIRLEGERRLSKFAHYAGRGSLGGWLRAVVYQCFIDRKRLTSRFEQVEEVEEFDRLLLAAPSHSNGMLASPPARPDELEDRRLREATETALARALATADTRTRLLLQFYYFDDLTLREIGQMMGVHEATISRWLARAQKDVRRRTEEILARDFGLGRREVAECLQLAARTEIDVRELLRDVNGPAARRAP